MGIPCLARERACRSGRAERVREMLPGLSRLPASRLASRALSQRAYNRCGEYSMKATAGLILAGLLLFGASFNDPFHFDDTLITRDSNVTNPAHWTHFFNPLYL